MEALFRLLVVVALYVNVEASRSGSNDFLLELIKAMSKSHVIHENTLDRRLLEPPLASVTQKRPKQLTNIRPKCTSLIIGMDQEALDKKFDQINNKLKTNSNIAECLSITDLAQSGLTSLNKVAKRLCNVALVKEDPSYSGESQKCTPIEPIKFVIKELWKQLNDGMGLDSLPEPTDVEINDQSKNPFIHLLTSAHFTDMDWWIFSNNNFRLRSLFKSLLQSGDLKKVDLLTALWRLCKNDHVTSFQAKNFIGKLCELNILNDELKGLLSSFDVVVGHDFATELKIAMDELGDKVVDFSALLSQVVNLIKERDVLAKEVAKQFNMTLDNNRYYGLKHVIFGLLSNDFSNGERMSVFNQLLIMSQDTVENLMQTLEGKWTSTFYDKQTHRYTSLQTIYREGKSNYPGNFIDLYLDAVCMILEQELGIKITNRKNRRLLLVNIPDLIDKFLEDPKSINQYLG